MKKNFVKTTVAAICVVAAGMGSLKAYNTANQSQADMLLAENVEVLSDPDGSTNTDDGDNGSSTISQGKWDFDRKDAQTKTVKGKQTKVYYYVYVCKPGDRA